MVAGMRGRITTILEILLSSQDVDGLIVLGLTGGTIELFSKYKDIQGSQDFGRATVDNFGQTLREVITLRNRYQKPVIVSNSMPFGTPEMALALVSLARETGTIFYNTPHHAVDAYAALSVYAAYLKKTEVFGCLQRE
jgi:acyl-CoA synthetase (NDP forming)